MQRVAGEIEEEDVTQAQHQAWHRHRDETEHAQCQIQAALAAGFFHQIGASKDQYATDQRGAQRHLHAVAIGQPATSSGVIELVMVERQRQVVRPELHQRRKHRHTEHQQQRGADQQHDGQIAAVTQRRRQRFEHLGATAH
ncbi:hypothetical protein D3C84_964480 [compost metagenome]